MVSSGKVNRNKKKILPDKYLYTFPNGLKLIVVEWHSLPMVHIDLMIKTGAFSEPIEKAGLAQAAVYLITQGTATRQAMQIAEETDFIGAKLINNSEEDASYLSFTVLKKHLPRGMEIFKDVLMNPSFPIEELERWQKRTIAAIAQEKADPSAVASKKFKKFVFGDYPYGNIMNENTVNKIGKDDVKNFYHAYYRPNNSVLVIVGDVNAKKISAEIKKLLRDWKRRPVARIKTGAPPVTSRYAIQFINKEDSNQAQIRFGYVSTRRDNTDYFPIVLLNYILGGGGFSSRLMKEIRSTKGYTYGINSNFYLYKNSGMFSITTFTKNETVPDVVNEIMHQLKVIKEKGISDEELRNAKSFYKGSFARRFERPEIISDQILDIELYGLGDEYLDTFKSKVDAVTKKKINNAILAYIQTESAAIVILGKAQDYAKEIKKIGKTETKEYNE